MPAREWRIIYKMFSLNVILFCIIFYFNFAYDWHRKEESDFIGILPIASPMVSLGEKSVFSESIPPRNLVDEIKRRPLFIEGRRRIEQKTVAETLTILIDGSQNLVELVGTIEANGQNAVAFRLDSTETIWLHQNEHLGDWQIEEITQREVRLRNQQEILVLRPRKNTDADAKLDG